MPAEQEATETVTEVPVEAEGVITQPVAVPVFEKSAEVRPLIDSEKLRVYEREAELVGEEGGTHVAVGAVLSTVKVVEEVPTLPCKSVEVASKVWDPSDKVEAETV